MSEIEKYIVTIPDFPKKGIAFRDITPILADRDALKHSVDALLFCLQGVEFDAIAALEARGFLFGMPMAYAANSRFLPIRKKGRLPRETAQEVYELEYGSAAIEVHRDDVFPKMRVVLADDLLATGGTLAAAARLLEGLGAEIVKIVTLLELKGLGGRERLKNYKVSSVVVCEDS